jgi:hypothetical protein
MEKLTDEELSRVLSQQAIGKLDHAAFYRESDECGCVAGAALMVGKLAALSVKEIDRCFEISDAVGGDAEPIFVVYPSTPEALLKMLADKGLA